jgi:hypothetical protein
MNIFKGNKKAQSKNQETAVAISYKAFGNIQKRLDEIIEVLNGGNKKRTFDAYDLIIAMIYIEALKRSNDPAAAERFTEGLKKYITT